MSSIDYALIHDALESTAPLPKDSNRVLGKQTATKYSIRLHAASIVRFLNELDPETTVGDLIEAIDNYG